MATRLFKSLWGWGGSLEAAIAAALAHGFDGLELNLHHPCLVGLEAIVVRRALAAAELELIVEVVTGGDYVPDLDRGPAQHLDDLGGNWRPAGRWHR